MRKHFLLLFLMALLPLAGWSATDTPIAGYTATLSAATSVYTGKVITAPTVTKFEDPNGSEVTSVTPTIEGWQDAEGNAIDGLPKNAGTYKAVIQAVGYSGTITADYVITPATLTVTAQNMTDAGKAITFGDEAPTAKYTVKITGFVNGEKEADVVGGSVTYTTLSQSDVAYEAGHATKGAVGTYKIVPSIANLTADNYTFTPVNGSLKVNAKTITSDMIAAIADREYNTQSLTPTDVTVKNGKVTLTKGTDYTLTFANPSASTVTYENTLEAKNAGIYNVKVSGSGNYTGTPVVTFRITKAPLLIKTKGNATDNATTHKKTYDGKLTTITAADNSKYLEQQGWLETGDFDFSTNLKVTLEPVADGTGSADGDAGDYTLVVASDGVAQSELFNNYQVTFSNKGTYTIEKKALTFALKPQFIAYNATNPFATAVSSENYLNAAVDPGTDFEIAKYPTIQAVTTTGAATYDLILNEDAIINKKATATTAAIAKTHNFAITLTGAKLTVEGGTISIIPEDITFTYGQTAPAIKFDIEGMQATDLTDAFKAEVKKHISYTDGYNAGTHTQKIIVDKAGLMASDYYKTNLKNNYPNVSAFKATYTIAQRQLTKIEVKDQSLNKGDKIDNLVKSEKTVVFTAAAVDGVEYPLTPDDYEQLQSEYKFVLTDVTYDGTNTDELAGYATGKTYGVIGIDYENTTNKFKNFIAPKNNTTEITLGTTAVTGKYTLGKLTISDKVANLVLARVAIPNAEAVDVQTSEETTSANTAYNLIKANSGNKVTKVTFTLPNHTMKAETWYSWVLPFATTVREISQAFGYAVVDILGEDGASSADDVKFKLHMGDIKANQPFILKVYKDIKPAEFEDANTNIKFEDVTILKDATATKNAPVVTDAHGNKFIGTYSGKYGLQSNEYLFRLGVNNYSQGGDGSQIRPLGAYIQFNTDAHAHVIYIEEPDGSTTAISSIAADGEMIPAEGWYTLNGVKLQGAPTEKGVYINNGKKVVVK